MSITKIWKEDLIWFKTFFVLEFLDKLVCNIWSLLRSHFLSRLNSKLKLTFDKEGRDIFFAFISLNNNNPSAFQPWKISPDFWSWKLTSSYYIMAINSILNWTLGRYLWCSLRDEGGLSFSEISREPKKKIR